VDNLLWRDRCLLQFANHKPNEIVVDVLNADDVRGEVICNKFLNRLKRMQQMQCVAVMRPVNAVIILRQYRRPHHRYTACCWLMQLAADRVHSGRRYYWPDTTFEATWDQWTDRRHRAWLDFVPPAAHPTQPTTTSQRITSHRSHVILHTILDIGLVAKRVYNFLRCHFFLSGPQIWGCTGPLVLVSDAKNFQKKSVWLNSRNVKKRKSYSPIPTPAFSEESTTT